MTTVGPTLEWYVADVLKTDYEGSSEWSVKLTGGRYGDYDVLGWLPPTLVYVETKSSDPRDVSDGELKNFLQRGVELVPELAILMVDTDDDLEQAGLIGRLFEIMLPAVRLANGISDSD